MSDVGSLQFLAIIPVVWCVLTWLLSRISGWSKLAQRYADSRPSQSETSQSEKGQGEKASLRTGRIGAVTYHSCLKFCVNDEGFRVAVAWPLRFGHRPLFIPWSDLHNVAEDNMMFSQKVKLSIGQPTLTRALFPGWFRYRMPMDMRPQKDESRHRRTRR